MKIYLGDGAYAEIKQPWVLEITAEDGIRATDRVVLEPDSVIAMFRFLEQAKYKDLWPRI
jgi:hypothetical protein